ncbi:hypothetical protein ACQB6R_13875 [Propionibacteriaceae bacterium G1746]|uniref:hypothetical protein n=1 Tax=Aestuariimicrobium sp. G57 TaxID=3418485 RepID=UPI003C18CC16
MTEHDDDRAERAFRDALAEHEDDAAGDDTAPAASPALPARRPRRWRGWAIAAAVVAVALVGGVAISQLGRDAQTASPQLPAPASRKQWISTRNVAVQVPVGWVSASSPGSDWCAGDRKIIAPGNQPYYDVFSGDVIRLAIGCPPRQQADDRLHVTMRSTVNGRETLPSWYRTRVVGTVEIAVAVPSGSAQDEATAEAILASATTFTHDQFGCAATSPIRRWDWARPAKPFDVTTVAAVESISLCQYAKASMKDADDPSGRPSLTASAQVSGSDAAAMLAAIKRAPAGTGPNEPQNCSADYLAAMAVVVQLNTAEGPKQLYSYLGNCRHNGIDDGTTMRVAQRGWCSVVAGTKPLFIGSMSQSVAEECLPVGPAASPTASPTR